MGGRADVWEVAFCPNAPKERVPRGADWQSAVRQVENLRDGRLPIGATKLQTTKRHGFAALV